MKSNVFWRHFQRNIYMMGNDIVKITKTGKTLAKSHFWIICPKKSIYFSWFGLSPIIEPSWRKLPFELRYNDFEEEQIGPKEDIWCLFDNICQLTHWGNTYKYTDARYQWNECGHSNVKKNQLEMHMKTGQKVLFYVANACE